MKKACPIVESPVTRALLNITPFLAILLLQKIQTAEQLAEKHQDFMEIVFGPPEGDDSLSYGHIYSDKFRSYEAREWEHLPDLLRRKPKEGWWIDMPKNFVLRSNKVPSTGHLTIVSPHAVHFQSYTIHGHYTAPVTTMPLLKEEIEECLRQYSIPIPAYLR